MFGLFKKKPKQKIKKSFDTPVSPFEILLPEELAKGEKPDLRMGSKTLDLLRLNSSEIQTLEVFEGMPVVNSNNPQLKQFIISVNGAKQTSTLKSQLNLMSFPPKDNKSLGILCCLVNGVLHEFHIYNRGGGATINFQFNQVVHKKA